MIKPIPENPRYLANSETGEIYDTKYNNRKICYWIDNTGYLQCNLYNNGVKVYRRVHRLIAETFLPNPLNLPQVNHKDGNKLNCKLYNLEWCNNSTNTQHGYDNNLYHFKDRRSYIIQAYEPYNQTPVRCKSIRDFCNKTGYNRKTVSSILNNGKQSNYNIRFEYVDESQTTIEMVRIMN